MDNQMTDLELTVERRIKAPAARLYDAWLDPAMLLRFMKAGRDVSVKEALTDPRVGGRFSITMQTPEREIPHTGTYLELKPHERMVFTWASPHSLEDSRVTLTFTPEGDGTLVTLHHIRFRNEGAREGHREGWSSILAAMAEVFGRPA